MTSQATTPAVAPTQRDRRILAIAWTGTLAVSHAPQVLLADQLGLDAAAVPWLWVTTAALLAVVASTWRPARPLRGYFTVMLAVVALAGVAVPLLGDLVVPDSVSDLSGAVANKSLFILLALGFAAFLVWALRLTPRNAFLTPGDLRAPSPLRLPGAGKPLTWLLLGPATAVLLAAAYAGGLWTDGVFAAGGLGRVVAAAPLIVAAAAFNAFGEEVMYRAGPLAMLHRVVGPRQAVWMTAAWFGLGHYHGSIPSGAEGVVMTGLLGLLLGKAMIDTRGLGWPLAIHVALDVVVFASIAAAI